MTTRSPRFLVVQYGARHGYAIPAAFAGAGALSGLYTDFTPDDGLGPYIGLAANLLRARTIEHGLVRRTLPQEVRSLTRSLGGSYLAGTVLERSVAGLGLRPNKTRLSRDFMEREMLRQGTLGATHVYTMLGEGGKFVAAAKAAGLGVVGDVYIALSSDAIVAAEEREFPDWCDNSSMAAESAARADANQVLLGSSDLFICPSEFVMSDLIAKHGVNPDRAVVIPYAVSARWFGLEPEPDHGRVLFAGTANVRKGIHYLAGAAKQLANRGYSFRVAGNAAAVVRSHPSAGGLAFLGHLGGASMMEEFRRADVLAFPSLAEGSAGVTAEALGAGVPVVTTRAAGSIVRHGIDGFIVPERDPHALADAIRRIVEDRELRDRMSAAARERAAQFTWDAFALNVIEKTRQLAVSDR